MATGPVNPKFIQIAAQHGIFNAKIAAEACREADLPFFVACALLEKESGGKNEYGRSDAPDAALSGFPKPVNKGNWEVFRWMVFDKGQTSNGVGPCQITYTGFFTEMEQAGLKPYDAHDNMLFGFKRLKGFHDQYRSWEKAGGEYNGGPAWEHAPDAVAYGKDLAAKVAIWKQRFGL